MTKIHKTSTKIHKYLPNIGSVCLRQFNSSAGRGPSKFLIPIHVSIAWLADVFWSISRRFALWSDRKMHSLGLSAKKKNHSIGSSPWIKSNFRLYLLADRKAFYQSKYCSVDTGTRSTALHDDKAPPKMSLIVVHDFYWLRIRTELAQSYWIFLSKPY